MTDNSYDVIIVGAGVYGLSIAYYLTKNPSIRTLLVEKYEIGHPNGSSHSPTRITRSTYDKELYRDLNTMGLNQHWKQLQKLLDCKLVYEAPFIYLDNQQHSFLEFKKVTEGQQNFEIITPEEVAMKYSPMPLIKTKHDVIVDKKAGILAAGDLIDKLKNYLVKNCQQNFKLLENTEISTIKQTSQGVQLITSKSEKLICKKVILSSGRWITELITEIKDHFKVVKQYVAYLQLKDIHKYNVQKFNSFYYRYTDETHFYCLPDHDQWGVKFGKHAFNLTPEQDNFQYQQKYLHKMAKQIFGEQQFIRIKKIQNCYYTYTPSEDFIIDYVNPQSEKILICSCCSGHGFKFAPVIGDVISQLVSKKQQNDGVVTNNEVFNKWQHMFKFAYHQGINLNQ